MTIYPRTYTYSSELESKRLCVFGFEITCARLNNGLKRV